MNKQKIFSYKDQEIINKYNKKRNQEITEEHLNNIEKLKEDFKKEIINEYKEKLIKELEKIMLDKNLYRADSSLFNELNILLVKIKNGEFDND
ncbi:hypothetical protein [Spiroplasma endosymbiont of Villa modesta]|uniref:hypothetical protein n=1 Tax=Spiroplasma endosymbiont of Villa modesta TaxID=3066293 RepID=UPI00313A9623